VRGERSELVSANDLVLLRATFKNNLKIINPRALRSEESEEEEEEGEEEEKKKKKKKKEKKLFGKKGKKQWVNNIDEEEATPYAAAAAAGGESGEAKTTYEIRASFTEATVRVYQAYSKKIAESAVANQNFVSSGSDWKQNRMTWIKPSAVWCGYRSGWGEKDAKQERILAIDLNRKQFDLLLQSAVLESEEGSSQEEVIVQWDPERVLSGDKGRKQAYTNPVQETRAIQIGLRGKAARVYGDGKLGLLVAGISDVTDVFSVCLEKLKKGDVGGAEAVLGEGGGGEECYLFPIGCAKINMLEVKKVEEEGEGDVEEEEEEEEEEVQVEEVQAEEVQVEEAESEAEAEAEAESSEEEEAEPDIYECCACRKKFKSKGQFLSHENSKKHKQAIKSMKK